MVGQGQRKERKQSNRKTLTGKVNGKAQRVRSGCLTCRFRRKKCDERKPGCLNCHRSGYHCEGYQKLRWMGDRATGTAAQTPVSQSEEGSGFASVNSGPVSQERTNEIPTRFEMWAEPDGHVDRTPRSVEPAGCPALMNPSHSDLNNLDDGLETVYTPLTYPQRSEFILDSGSAYFPGGYENMHQVSTRPRTMSYVPQSMVPFTNAYAGHPSLEIPKPLIYPVPNIDSPVHRRMFHHFTNDLSKVLTTSNSSQSPIAEVVIPLAIKDRNLMRILLAFSGSHLLKRPNMDPDGSLERERDRLHATSVQMQARRQSLLLEWSSEKPESRKTAYSLQDQEVLLGSSILLCLNELCVGSEDKSLHDHLDMARYSITLLSPQTQDMQPREAIEKVVTDVDPLLLEFFNYHDSLAAVTIPTNKRKPLYVSTASINKHVQPRISLIEDDLLAFMNRIAPLRTEPSIGVAMSQAASISHDLENWRPHYSFTKDQRMIGEFYKWSLSIWLYSILNPENKADPKIQDQLSSITSEMQDISDSVKACLLFPLFIVGGAAISEEHKTVVRGLFKMLMDWSSLGNIGVALKVVENMWADYEAKKPKAWDWVTQLEDFNTTLLVT